MTLGEGETRLGSKSRLGRACAVALLVAGFSGASGCDSESLVDPSDAGSSGAGEGGEENEPRAGKGGRSGSGGKGGSSAQTGGSGNDAGSGESGVGGDDAPGGIGGAGAGADAGSAGEAATGGSSGGRSGSGGQAGRGGSAGSAGSAGRGGTGGSGTSGSGGGASVRPGGACSADANCPEGLFCLTNDAFAGSGPPGGLCTMRCTTDGQCLELDDDLYCVQFTDTTRVCLEGCTTGSAGEPKCHQRDDFACSLLGVIPGSVVCDSSDDCQAGELCDATGVCGKIVTSCLPTCGGNFDCGPGQFCSFASGFCLNQQPGGLPLGSACTESDPDPCNGFCTEGECSALCTITTLPFGCGWNGQGVAEAACLFTTFLSPPGDAGIGDVGLCGKLCDCNAECPLAGEYCVDESEGLVLDVWGRNGYCRPLATGETEADSFSACP